VHLHRATLVEVQPAALARLRLVVPAAGTHAQRRFRLDQ